MRASDIPAKFPIPWGANAGAPYIRPIPVNSQIGLNPGFASLNDGFVPLNMTPTAAGGIPPFGQDINGILRETTSWDQWQQAGGPVRFDADFSAAIDGYPKGATVQSAVNPTLFWMSFIDDNTSDPDAGGAGWMQPFPSTGDWKWRPTSEIIPGWVKANFTTIGSPASNASQLADPSALWLYTWLWTNFTNAQCPVYTSAGVITTRGLTAIADFAANKQIAVFDMRGVGPIGMDTMGGLPSTYLANVPVTSGSATVAGSVLGENLHPLSSAELATHIHAVFLSDPGHTHTITNPNYYAGLAGDSAQLSAAASGPLYGTLTNSTNQTGITVRDTAGGGGTANQTASTGAGTAHNTVQRSITGTHYFRL